MKLGLAGKMGGAFATADYVHGGGELGIRTILDYESASGYIFRRRSECVIDLAPSPRRTSHESRSTFELYGKRMAKKRSNCSTNKTA